MKVPEYQQSVKQQGFDGRQNIQVDASNFLGGTQAAALKLGAQSANDLSTAVQNHYIDQVKEARQTRVLDAATQMQTHVQDAMYGPNGALQKKGADAFLGSDGKSAMDLYIDDAQTKQNAIADTLGDEEMKSAFKQHTNSMLMTMRGQLMGHEADQHKAYTQSTLESSTTSHLNNMSLNYNDKAGLTKSIDQIKANSTQLGKLQGYGPEWGAVNAQTHISSALNKIVANALDKNDQMTAHSVLQNFAKDMNQNDLATNYTKMSKATDQANAVSVATSTMSDFRGRFTPQPGTRVDNITFGAESGNKQFAGKFYGLRPDGTAKGTGYLGELKRPDGGVMTEYSIGVNINGKDMDIPTIVPTLSLSEINHLLNSKDDEKIPQAIVDKAVAHARQRIADGNPVFHDTPEPITSPKGAVGAAQVMRDTGPEAAKLAGLPWDETRWKYDIDYNKAIGSAYFQKQLQDNHSDLEKAWGAYNAGPGALKNALAEAATDGTDWRTKLPTETQDYITKNINAYNAGAGADEPPTLQEVQAAALAKNPSASMEERNNTIQEVTRQFTVNQSAIKEHEDYSTEQAYKELEANGGNFAALPQSIRDSIPGDKLNTVHQFAENKAKGVPVETNFNVFYDLYNDPAMLKITNLKSFTGELSTTDLHTLTKLQAENNKSNDLTTVRPAKAVMDDYLSEVGINPSPKAGDKEGSARVSRIYSQFETKLNAFEDSVGRKATPDEVKEQAKKFFVPVDIKGALWGTNKTTLAQMNEGDVIAVPSDERAQIVQLYKAKNGGAYPSDDYILSTYKEHKGIN